MDWSNLHDGTVGKLDPS